MWGEAVLSACFVLNRIPHKRLDKTPYELWKGHAQNLSYLKVWGCLAKVPFPALKKSTVGSKTFDCIFIGYAQNSAAYSLSKRMHDHENPSIVSETPVSETVDTSNLRCELELRRSKRQRTEKSFGPDFLSTFIVETRDEIDCNFTNLYLIDEDPKTYQEALNYVGSSMWKEAIKSELDSLIMNHTWDLVDLPMGNKPIRYLGEADVILGVIRKNKTSLSLCQSHYVEKILKKFDSFDVSPVRTPFDTSKYLKKNKGDSVSQPEYAKIIGSVMYLMNYTRSDIAYDVSRLSRYTHNPDRYHGDALCYMLRYLKGTIDYCLHFNKFSAVLEGYCDANWVTDNDEVNFTSGSTMESEFIALELAGQEAEWIKNLLEDVPLWETSVPVSIQCDSQAAICTAKNSVYNLNVGPPSMKEFKDLFLELSRRPEVQSMCMAKKLDTCNLFRQSRRPTYVVHVHVRPTFTLCQTFAIFTRVLFFPINVLLHTLPPSPLYKLERTHLRFTSTASSRPLLSSSPCVLSIYISLSFLFPVLTSARSYWEAVLTLGSKRHND
ncbi:ty1-copia retrotransposon protein [Cucumis melo var. makuwa]|uniref:Ty1-copia retrotransposon protein n=1 Tax=Cucumis melo var. makuwa TaxID=1194695 RepID=A0A5A7U8F0_CUCMM|nr:ty1-copia retrotransposon protein [Cucumis melo var. makuwa]